MLQTASPTTATALPLPELYRRVERYIPPFEWPILVEGMSVVTSVVYELSPKGPETVIHVSHRSPKPVPGDWNAVWSSAIESLKAYVESARTDSTTMDSP